MTAKFVDIAEICHLNLRVILNENVCKFPFKLMRIKN